MYQKMKHLLYFWKKRFLLLLGTYQSKLYSIFIIYMSYFKCVFLLAVSMFTMAIIDFSNRASAKFNLLEYTNKLSYTEEPDQCVLPKLQLTGHSNRESLIDCKLNKNWGLIKNNKWILDDSVKNMYGNISCKYRNITRIDDFKLNYSDYEKLDENSLINSEVIDVYCSNENNSVNYDNLHAQIIPKYNQFKSFSNNKDEMCEPLNVLLISYDSVSQVSFKLRLNKTFSYMENKMNFQIINGFNIIGDGTPPCIIPVLTGKTEEELPSALKNDVDGKYVDEVYPFIFKELHEKGIKT